MALNGYLLALITRKNNKKREYMHKNQQKYAYTRVFLMRKTKNIQKNLKKY